MQDNRFHHHEQAAAAMTEDLKRATSTNQHARTAEYVAEMVRQLIFAQYGAEAYTRPETSTPR